MDITTLGELLIDFTSVGNSATGMRLFEQNPGGAPANVAVAGARLGLNTAFIGKVGGDMHGAFLRSVLDREGVDTRGLITDAECRTTLAFVSLDESGEREFSFYRGGSADVRLTPDEVDAELIASSKILHIGTLSLTDEPARSATFRAIELAKRVGAIVSCDVNYRAQLWRSEAEFCGHTAELLRFADMVKVSEEEAALLTGCGDPQAAANALLDTYDLRVAAVTSGERGSYVLTRRGGVAVPAIETPAIDTTGAGDSYWAGFLYSFLQSGAALDELDAASAARFARFGSAAASVCVERHGAIPAVPTLGEVLARLGE
ncbi:MAG: carbohydrate kinase [Oscillospiraceae bacterium]|jgi:fructokinase|nr:carbohydrate kinase [Oscillospiraceae bacterium]